MLRILIFASNVYLVKDIVFINMKHQSIKEYFINEFSFYKILKMLLFDDSLIRVHLWFIVAMLYLYLAWLIAHKLGVLQKIVRHRGLVIIVFFSINLLLGEVPYLFGFDLPVCFIRNWLLTGIPAFLLGYCIRNDQVDWSKGMIMVFLALGIFESWYSFSIIGRGDTYLGSIILAYCLIYGIRWFSEKRYPILSYVGQNCSLFIYLYHILLAEILPNMKFKIVVVFLMSIFLSLVYNQLFVKKNRESV